MKKLLIFLSGFVTGVIAVNLYELFGVPAMPNEDYEEFTQEEIDDMIEWEKISIPNDSLEDTQPIYIRRWGE